MTSNSWPSMNILKAPLNRIGQTSAVPGITSKDSTRRIHTEVRLSNPNVFTRCDIPGRVLMLCQRSACISLPDFFASMPSKTFATGVFRSRPLFNGKPLYLFGIIGRTRVDKRGFFFRQYTMDASVPQQPIFLLTVCSNLFDTSLASRS